MIAFLLQESDYTSDTESGDDEEVDRDEGPDYIDGDSDLEDLLCSDECELPEPAQITSGHQQAKVILTMIVYFVFVWQYKNYVSDNAIEQLLKVYPAVTVLYSKFGKATPRLGVVRGFGNKYSYNAVFSKKVAEY